MLETSARLLRLLALLQSRRDWNADELADRLTVTDRTIRRDVDKLRSLGYPVDAVRGHAGGYRLAPGVAMPPMLLDDDEAVALVVGLRGAAAGSVAGLDESAARALVKLEQVLPARLRHRVRTLAGVTTSIPGVGSGVDPDVLVAVAGAARDHQRLRMDYRSHDGTTRRREVEPHRLVLGGRRWYLVAWDLERADWRTFRLDRVTPVVPTGPRFLPRDPPDADPAAYVARGVTVRPYPHRARLTVLASAAEVSEYLAPSVATITVVDADRCEVEVGGATLDEMVLHLGLLPFDIVVHEPPDLIARLTVVRDRLDRMLGPPGSAVVRRAGHPG